MRTIYCKLQYNKRLHYLIAYTVIFTIIFLIGFWEFIFGNSTFLYYGDALVQSYPALEYIRNYMRELPSHIMNGQIPMYDFSIGLGDDILATLMVLDANFLVNSIYAMIPWISVYALYVLIFTVRLYLSGLAFSYFCFSAFPSLRQSKRLVLLGSLMYVFSGWTCFYVLRHPCFMTALLYFPLIMAGFEKVLQDKKPYLFITSVFMLALSGFYFIYMVTLFMIVYTIIRVHMLYEDRYLKYLFKIGLKLTSFYLVAMMMASITFIPLILAHLNTGREAHIPIDSLLFYPLQDYINSLASYTAPIPSGKFWIYIRLGMSAGIPVALLLMLFQRPVKKHILVGVVVTFFVQNIPLGTYVLTGFSSVSHRPEFLFNLVYCLAFIFIMRDYKSPSKPALITLSVYTILVFISTFFVPVIDDNSTFFPRVGALFIAIIIFILFAPADNPYIRFITETRRPILLSAVILINIIFNVNIYFLFSDLGYVNKTAGDLYEDYISVQDTTGDDSFFRQGTPFTIKGWHFNDQHYINSSMLFGYYGFTYYWSLSNPSFSTFSLELENARQPALFRIQDLNNRTALMQLLSVKYLFANSDTHLFEYEVISNLPYRVLYRNKNALPLGYTYDKTISYNDYYELHALDKQEVLMQAVVLPDEYKNVEVSDLIFSKTFIPTVSTLNEGMLWESGILISNIIEEETTDSDSEDDSDDTQESMLGIGFGSIRLNDGIVLNIDTELAKLSCEGNCETYVRFSGLNSNEDDIVAGTIYAEIKDTNLMGSFTFFTNIVPEYHGNENYSLNLGYSENPVTGPVTLALSNGVFTLDNIELFCVSMDNYSDYSSILSEDVLENIEIGVNSISGNISLNRNKVLVLSIPYSRGWSAKVNGADIELLQANTAFMAIPLEPGDYEIELNYETPGLRFGAYISLVGLCSFIVIILISYRKTKDKDVI